LLRAIPFDVAPVTEESITPASQSSDEIYQHEKLFPNLGESGRWSFNFGQYVAAPGSGFHGRF
jgi:hypothetical protein